ncbi:MAG: hypothetical protein GY719_08570 [bacterium]|nr:hypothetical protein [bacterium]
MKRARDIWWITLVLLALPLAAETAADPAESDAAARHVERDEIEAHKGQPRFIEPKHSLRTPKRIELRRGDI